MASPNGGSRGYNTRAAVSPAPGAFYIIYASDFGANAPAAPALAYEAGSGSLATSTAYVKVTWITAEGESSASAEATVGVAAGSGAVQITQPAVPTNGQTVIGWRVYSSGTTTGAEHLNTAAASTTQAQTTFATTQGSLTGFPVATTTVLLKVYGTGAVPPVNNASGIQAPLPSVAGASTADYDAVVPNTGSQWKVQKSVDFMRSDGTAETAGIVLSEKLDLIQPLYPGVSTSVANGTWMVMNGYLFQATQSGSQNTAATFIGFSKFNLTKGATTTDGSVTWTSFGKAALVRFHFANVTASAATPVAQTYEIFQQ